MKFVSWAVSFLGLTLFRDACGRVFGGSSKRFEVGSAHGKATSLPIGQPEAARATSTSERSLSLAVVVVRCNEQVGYLKRLADAVPAPFRLVRVHVVEKCCEATGSKANGTACAPLPDLRQGTAAGLQVEVNFQKNVGLALYGYATHIVDNHEHLEDFTAFLEADSINQVFDLCDLSGFLTVARARGYAGLGFHYVASQTSGEMHMPCCGGRAVPLGKAGPTMNVYNSAFVASRDTIKRSVPGFQIIAECFAQAASSADPLKIRIAKKHDHHHLLGFLEGSFFEQSGHLLFGQPLQLLEQGIKPCGKHRVYHQPVSR